MGVKKIFIVLITVVACVIIGALVLNTLLPNVTTALIDSTEDMIYKATKMDFDFNGNGNTGKAEGTEGMENDDEDMDNDGAGVEGFN